MTRTFRWIAAFLAAVVTAASSAVLAQSSDWPTRTVRIIVPYPPGGMSDFLARVLSQRLSEKLGQSFVVENRPGASGNIGAEAVAKAPGDGYTLMIGGPNNFASNQFLFHNLGYDIEKDLTAVTVLEEHPTVIAVPNASPVKDVKALIAASKAKPNSFNCGTPGMATLAQLTMELFKEATGADLQNIAFKGTGQVVTEMLAGRLDCAFDGLPAHLKNIQAGSYRALAVSSKQRDKALPDVPTLAESGYPTLVAANWFALAVSAKTPPATIDRIAEEVNKVLREPEVIARFSGQGALPVGGSPAQSNAFFRTEAAKWKRIIELANIKPE
jgi:tripartite-type tricarboxylate transporter receptor subunit TctC